MCIRDSTEESAEEPVEVVEDQPEQAEELMGEEE